MPRILYQVGDFPLFNHMVGVGGGSVGMDDGRDWRIPTSTVSEIPGEYFAGTYYNPLANTPKLKVKGSFENGGGMTVDQKLGRLMFYSGRTNVPFIALDYQACDCSEDGSCGHVPTISWVLAYGQLLKVDRNLTWVEKDDTDPLATISVNLDIELEISWHRLSPFVWEYRKNTPIVDPFDDACLIQGSTGTRFPHPNKVSYLTVGGFFYKWGDELVRYDPNFWEQKYTEGLSGGVGRSYFSPPHVVKVLPDINVWNAPPLTMYAITRSDGAGSVEIKVQYPTAYGAGALGESISTLNLATVHSELAALGYGGLEETDVIITGSVNPYPSFVMRDDEIIPDYIPNWSYPHLHPGQLFAGPNRIEFQISGTEARLAYLVDYGAY